MRVLVTGASGWIGSALLPDLIAAGHTVTGLARSDEAAEAVTATGAQALRGTIDDLDLLRRAAADADGVVHLAFKTDLAFAGDIPGATTAERNAIESFGEALAGTGRPLVVAAGVAGIAPGRVVTEQDNPEPDPEIGNQLTQGRLANSRLALSFTSRGIRASVVRLPITTHGEGDTGLTAVLVGIAREQGVAGYIGDGANRWSAGHRFDAAKLFRLALEKAPAGTLLHATAEEGLPMRDVAEAIARRLGLPAASIAQEDAAAHFGWMSDLVGMDCAASSERTRELLNWRPIHPGLIDDLEKGHYG